jgi:hypothetical protein
MTQNKIEMTANGGGVFAGPKGVDVYVLTVLASGLTLYAKSGMMPNRAWTPKRMMQAAANHTGKKFKARAYLEAAEALKAKAVEVAAEVKQEMANA